MVCGKFSWVMPLCRKCALTVYDVHGELSAERCSRCGKILVSEEKLCMECRGEGVYKNTDKVIPLFGYRLWNKELLFRWKILGERTLSPFLASCVDRALKIRGVKVVVPVPPRKGKIQKKGWDQIEEICSFLESRYDFLVLRILQRNSAAGSEQKKLDRAQRIETIGKTYSLVPEKQMAKELKKNGGKMPETCCLVDDILTTGATAESCAEVLKKGGVKEVDVVALFTAA